MDKLPQIPRLIKTAYLLCTTRMCSTLSQHSETPKVAESESFIQEEVKDVDRKTSFRYLLRHSPFIDLGQPKNKIVQGTIFQVVEDDLYIDFNWKFHCVCQRPVKNKEKYRRGTKVNILVKNLELSTRFLGATKDITLCEADCSLIGLVQEPKRNITQQKVDRAKFRKRDVSTVAEPSQQTDSGQEKPVE